MENQAEALRQRTKRFAVQIIRFCMALPRTDEGRTIGRQLLKSGTSVGANYRAVCRARSKAEFIAKMCIVVEEADETCYWLEVLEASGISLAATHTDLLKEANELLRIFAASLHTSRGDRDESGQSSNHQITKSPNRMRG